MKKIFFAITIGMLAAQGCTVNVNPTAVEPTAHEHPPASSRAEGQGSGNQGVAGTAGIHGSQQQTGTEGRAGQVMRMRRSAAIPVQPAVGVAHSHVQESKGEPNFGKEFWGGIVKTVAPIVAPIVATALLRDI
uniref:Lipoprotein n=1 Tax=uncultured Thiotrichaceae bacterium TaxID=298394 RepID=A0A6S6TVV8_9GAMM|nr:MAG: Unknown protein [uncultured Thiotrichaceae bacterium]